MVDSFASALKINPWLQTNGGQVWGGGRAPFLERGARPPLQKKCG